VSIKESKKAVVNLSICRGCLQCISSCPEGAIRVVRGRPWIDEDKCLGCGICTRFCPFQAIRIVSSKKANKDREVKEIKDELGKLRETLFSVLARIDKLSNDSRRA